MVKELNATSFNKEIKEKKKVMLVDFWASFDKSNIFNE